jgi:lysophospholipase L1-like esterase
MEGPSGDEGDRGLTARESYAEESFAMKMNDNSPFRSKKLMGVRRAALKGSLIGSSCALALGLASCSSGGSSSSSTSTTTAQASNAGNFTTTVFLGDSLTAGYQSGALLDADEVHGWAPLVAAQANFPIVQALIAPPGAPGVLELQSISPLVIVQTPGTTTGRDNAATQVTDLAVPGAELNDTLNTVPVASPTTGEQQITQLVLGFPGLGLGEAYSQAQFAQKANPTTIFLWIGNNDALVADETGMPSSMTSVSDFTTQYQALISYLTKNTKAHLVIGTIPDVTIVPYMTPAATVLAEASAESGLPTATLSVVLGISAGDLVNPEGLAEVTAILTGQQKTPISDAGVLTAAEVVQVQTQVTAFNQVITAQASAAGATLVDTNGLIEKVATQGYTIGGYTGTNAFLNGFFSLDGIHPTNTGYAVIANGFIDTMNAAFKTSIPDVNLAAVAAADPLWPPNFGAGAGAGASAATQRKAGMMKVPTAAVRSLDSILIPDRLRTQR